MRYVIRNSRPAILHLPDAGLRLDAGQTAVVKVLSPQMEELLAHRALELLPSDDDLPVAPLPAEGQPAAMEAPAGLDCILPVAPGRKPRKASTTIVPEATDDAP